MLATCPACGADVPCEPGSTILRCPACRRYVPAGDMRFESRPLPAPDRSQPPARRQSRLTLSPTARAFLLAILVVAAMAWIVRLFKIGASSPRRSEPARTACQDAAGAPASPICRAKGAPTATSTADGPALTPDPLTGQSPAAPGPAPTSSGPSIPAEGAAKAASKAGAPALEARPTPPDAGIRDALPSDRAPGTESPDSVPAEPVSASVWLKERSRDLAERTETLCQRQGRGISATGEFRVYAEILASLQISEQALQRLATRTGVPDAVRREIVEDLAGAPVDAPYYLQAMADHALAMARLAAAMVRALDAEGRVVSASAELQAALAQPPVSPWDRLAAALSQTAEGFCLAAQLRGAPSMDLRGLRAGLQATPDPVVLVRCAQAAALLADAASTLADAMPGPAGRNGIMAATRAHREARRRQASDNITRLAVETEAMSACLTALTEP
jgi:hypothetical protein